MHNSITKKTMFFCEVNGESEMRLKPFGCKEQDELLFDKAGHIKTPRKSSIGIQYIPGPSLVFNWQPKRKVLVVDIINSRYVTNKSTKEDLQGSNIEDSKFLLHFFLCTFVVLDSWDSVAKAVLI